METANPPGTDPGGAPRAGRSLATIVRVTTREKGFIFVHLVETDEECFVHKSTVPPDLWHELTLGDAVTCKVQETSKGLRGYEVVAGSEEDQSRVTAEEEFRGNRGQRPSG